MSYSPLSPDPLDLDPPTDVPLDEDLVMMSTPEQTYVYNTTAGIKQNQKQQTIHPQQYHHQQQRQQQQQQQSSFYTSAQDPQYPKTPPSPLSTNGTPYRTNIIISPIDDKRKSYPLSIVWGTLPLISWCLPCIGHLGICDSRGEIHDFHGPYDVRKGKFMVGPVLRYYQLPQEQIEQLHITDKDWDQAIYKSDLHYSGTVHNIVSNNCHHHVATALTNVGMELSMIQAWWLIITKGRWVSGQKAVCNVLVPAMICWGIIIGIIIFFTKMPFSGN